MPTAPVNRFFLSEDKVDHFLKFITSDVISQDTAYGTPNWNSKVEWN